MLRCWRKAGLRVELWSTKNIVTEPPGGSCVGLVNSANEKLVGTRLPYFPMEQAPPGGVEHSMWGGMEAGSGMFYASQVVDGHVSALGGTDLRDFCESLPSLPDGTKCRVGESVLSPAFDRMNFSIIAHTVAPPYEDSKVWEDLLTACYHSSISQLWGIRTTCTINSPNASIKNMKRLDNDGIFAAQLKTFRDLFRTTQSAALWSPEMAAQTIAIPILGSHA